MNYHNQILPKSCVSMKSLQLILLSLLSYRTSVCLPKAGRCTIAIIVEPPFFNASDVQLPLQEQPTLRAYENTPLIIAFSEQYSLYSGLPEGIPAEFSTYYMAFLDIPTLPRIFKPLKTISSVTPQAEPSSDFPAELTSELLFCSKSPAAQVLADLPKMDFNF